uniref:Sexual differentiation process putative subtilase-type proteinase isp6-like n=1 Tax=Saccoglossus kowalevskii TaxID=10224 RepID=A0ABM0MRI9_SACKO
LEYVVANGVKPGLIVMALSGQFLQSMHDAVESAIASGFSVVVAAGNEGQNACDFTPSSSPSSITVAATASDDHATDYSNYGSCVDIYAPGNFIRTPGFSNKDTRLISGTSMACPFVAGIVAIHLQKNPNLTPDEVKTAILDTCTHNQVYGDGIANGSPNRLAYLDPLFMTI